VRFCYQWTTECWDSSAPSGPRLHRVAIAHPQLRAATARAQANPAPIWIRGVYVALGAVLAIYFVSLLIRGPSQQVNLIDGWGVATFEFVASSLCLWRAVASRRRTVPLLLGLGILSWSIGDAILASESAGGATPGVPSLADLFYLGFYPIVYVALVLLTRKHLNRLGVTTWLDGAVAGLGAAALCACFAFNTVLHSVGGDASAVATDLAYPIGDGLLLILAVGGTAIITGRKKTQWLLIAGAIAMTAVGDTFNLFASSGATSHVGSVFNSIAWPCAILLISIAVWVRPLQKSPLAIGETPGFLLPGLGAAAGLSILVVDTLHQVTPVAVGLATATLITVGVRLTLSVRSLRLLTEKRHRQAITDELTGLGNRRQLFNSQPADESWAQLPEQCVAGGVTEVRVGASIGIASAPSDATDSAGLLRCADLAMYRAKVGPAPYELYRREVDDDGNRLRLVDELRDAILAGDLEVYYQPQIDLVTGERSAMEALVRWPHPRLGLIPPLDFIPLAEEAGLMQSLTALVLERAVEQCAAWRAGGQPLTVSVNVSATNLLDSGFSGSVMATLARHDVAPASLILEITETTIIRDFDLCKLVIAQLRNLGLGVSIDDFGAGVTSLAYLGSLAASELKLDRSFLSRLATGDTERNVALVRATIALGHKLNMRVVAEGIEDVDALNLLTSIGCDLAQGYYISEPMRAQDLGPSAVRHSDRPSSETAVA
jgi:EAL domain-containing protein (putative c-di-GMP-specific phosphodiesterase class I)